MLTTAANTNYINADEGLALVRGNKAIYKKVLGLFLASTEFAVLQEALDNQEYERAGEIAHGIKGMTGNLALTQLYGQSAQLMQALRSGGPNKGQLAQYTATLQATQAAVRQLLAQWEAEGQ